MNLADLIRSLPADSARDLLRACVPNAPPSAATFLRDAILDNLSEPPAVPAIYDELITAIHGMTPAEHAWLTKRGAVCPLIGCCGAADEAERWVPSADSARAFIFPVLAGPHRCGTGHRAIGKLTDYTPLAVDGTAVEVVDLAAWRPSAPAVVRLRAGGMAALGEWNLEMQDGPLRIRATPLAWAAADFDGAVILDWEACAGALLEQRHIACDSLDLAEKLNEVLARERKRATPRKPEVGVVKDG